MIKVCYRWGDAEIPWSSANWTWSECQLVAECIRWITAGQIWKYANWKWSECSGSFIPPTPPIPVVGIQPYGVDATTLIQPWLIEPWNPFRTDEQKKKLIRLICKVKGEEYDESKESKDFNISIDDVKFVINKITGINLDMKLEE
jgi:hypothetical protein